MAGVKHSGFHNFVFISSLILSYLVLVLGLGVLLKNLYSVSFLTTFVLSLNSIIILFSLYYLYQIGIKISKKLLVPVFFLSIIILAEMVFAYVDVTKGLFFHIFIILLALLSSFYLKTEEANMAQAFILVSLLRLVNVGLPLEGISIYFQFLVIYSLLLVSIGAYLYKQGIGLFDLGVRSEGLMFGMFLGISFGVLFGFTEYFVLGVTRVFPSFFLASLSVFFILGLVEEVIFRGVLLKSIESVDPFSAILLSSIVFGVMHSVWIKPLEYFFTFYAGLVLAVIYYKTKSLTAPVVAHTVINFVLFQFIPFRFV